MAQVQRGNVFLTVPEADVDKYMSKGFSLVDESGRVIKQCVPTEIGQLQKAYSEHVETIKQRDEEIAKLRAELEALKSAGVKKTPATKSESEESWDNWETSEEPKRKKKA